MSTSVQKLDERLAVDLWRALGASERHAAHLGFVGEEPALPGAFHVSSLATASIGVATLAAAELWAVRTGAALRGIEVDRGHASAAFRLERFMKADGWTLPPIWDPIAGDYEACDGWVRLHTNYVLHRDAATAALGVEANREIVKSAVRARSALDVEEAVVARGGCAAALRSRAAWKRHPQGEAVAAEALVARSPDAGDARAAAPARGSAEARAPLAGLLVLDLTRVIAGPVCTRLLAAYGADVLRLDPPGFEEVPLLLPEMTRGKRCAFVDLKTDEGRRTFDALLARADVLVHGYRRGALEALGYSPERLQELKPRGVTIRMDAYGHTGPWAERRGFDSLVQMSTGIADPGNGGRPTPLPAQALDHATGYLMAAAACRALVDGTRETRLSLARTAALLVELGTRDDAGASGPDDPTPFIERVDTAWGRLDSVKVPGRIEGCAPVLPIPAGPLGRDAPAFEAV